MDITAIQACSKQVTDSVAMASWAGIISALFYTSETGEQHVKVIQRILGAYSLVIAVLVGVFFFITPLFDDGSTGYPTWVILNWFMAPGVAIACAASLRWKLALSTGGEPDIRNYIGDNVLFYSALVLALWYLSNWLGDMVGEEVPLLWSFIDPLYVAVTGACGVRLWRAGDTP